MTENIPELPSDFIEKLKQQTELLEQAVDKGENLGDSVVEYKRRVMSGYQMMGTPYVAKVLNERQQKAKLAKRRAVKAARKLNR